MDVRFDDYAIPGAGTPALCWLIYDQNPGVSEPSHAEVVRTPRSARMAKSKILQKNAVLEGSERHSMQRQFLESPPHVHAADRAEKAEGIEQPQNQYNDHHGV